MKRRIVSVVLVICFAVLFLVLFLLNWHSLEEDPEFPAWCRAYEEFLRGERYLDDGLDFGTEISPFISLHDMDRDGVPELSITNGYTGRAVRCAYLYTCMDGKVQYLGIGPTDSFSSPDSAFPGILGYFYIGGNSCSWTYYRKDGGKVSSEIVYILEDGEYSEKTENEALFEQVQQKGQLRYIVDVSITEVEEMGWDTFFSGELEKIVSDSQPDTAES